MIPALGILKQDSSRLALGIEIDHVSKNKKIILKNKTDNNIIIPAQRLRQEARKLRHEKQRQSS